MTGRGDLGHFDNLLGNRCVDLSAYLQQLVRHLRHRNFKRRHDERVVANLLHGAPLVPFLRPDANEAVRPSPFGVSNSSTPNPPWSWPSSGFVERRTSRALHLGTKSGAGLRPTPCARSSARVAATSGAGAPSSAVRSQKHGRDQHKETRALLNGYNILKE